MSEISEHIMHMRVAQAEISRLKAELESKDKAIKLLQGYCNALMDTEGKLAQWKKGHTAGQEAAGYYQKQADDIIRQLRKELSDENANFTEEIMNLERQLAEARAEVRQVEQSAINFHEAWQQALNDLESARSALLEITKIRLEPGYCYEQAVRMQEIAKTVLRRGEG